MEIHPVIEFMMQIVSFGIACGVMWVLLVLFMLPITGTTSAVLWYTFREKRTH